MPPKSKFKKEDIINAAFNVVRKKGMQKLSARAISEELGASTMPIYSYIESMAALEEEVIKKAMDLHLQYMTTPRTGDPGLDIGFGYIRFAREEKHLFRCVTDERHIRMITDYFDETISTTEDMLKDHPMFEGMTIEQVKRVGIALGCFLHGMASLINNSWDKITTDHEITEFIAETYLSFLSGYRGLVLGKESDAKPEE